MTAKGNKGDSIHYGSVALAVVMNVGIAFGAGLYEQRIILPQWFSRLPESGLRVDSEAMRRTDARRKFRAYVTTVPLTLLTLTSLAVGWQTQGVRYDWWLSAAAIILVERIGTFDGAVLQGAHQDVGSQD